MTVQCIDCGHFALRGAGEMARLGYGHCDLEPSAATFQSAVFERQCGQFVAADDDTSAKRRAWLDGEKNDF